VFARCRIWFVEDFPPHQWDFPTRIACRVGPRLVSALRGDIFLDSVSTPKPLGDRARGDATAVSAACGGGRSEPKMVSVPDLQERVDRLDKRETVEVGIPRLDPTDAVLVHQHGGVCVVHEVSRDARKIVLPNEAAGGHGTRRRVSFSGSTPPNAATRYAPPRSRSGRRRPTA